MPLNDAAFAKVLEGIFRSMWNSADGKPYTYKRYAKEMAKAINDEIRNGDVQPGISLQADEHSGATTGIGKVK